MNPLSCLKKALGFDTPPAPERWILSDPARYHNPESPPRSIALLTCSSANADRDEVPLAFRRLFQRVRPAATVSERFAKVFGSGGSLGPEKQLRMQRRAREKYGPLT